MLHWNFYPNERPNYWLDERTMMPSEDGRGELHDGVHYRLTPMAETLVLLTMPCGIQKVTEKNADEFYARLKVLEAVEGGAFFRGFNDAGQPEDVFITPDHVQAVIGLHVNVSPEPTASWRNRIIKQHFEAAKNGYRREVAKQKKETVA